MKPNQLLLPLSLMTCFTCASWRASAEEVKRIEDNSFLIEEAYNQEAGVVQYIQAFQYSRKSKEWLYTFTHEMPFPNQTHQLSYTVPLARVSGNEFYTGVADVALNYRYQMVNDEQWAVSPRLSLILPTGDYKKGLGQGALGYQVNLPVSWVMSDKWVSHWNAGGTYTPEAREATGIRADLSGYNYGGSIIYLQSENFNYMVEVVKSGAQSLASNGSKTWDTASFINPGFRAAINHASGWQTVYGVGFPIGIGPSKGDNGVLVYLSFEK